MCRFDRPLRIAALIKQIPVGESMTLGDDGRLVREGLELEMNAYCRRAVSQGRGVGPGRAAGPAPSSRSGLPRPRTSCVRRSPGGPTGACTCATRRSSDRTPWPRARSLAAALRRDGEFDLVLVGRNSLDGDTGQVGPEIAAADRAAVCRGRPRTWALTGERCRSPWSTTTAAKRSRSRFPLCSRWPNVCASPARSRRRRRAEVSPETIRRVTADELGAGPWGQEGSPTGWAGHGSCTMTGPEGPQRYGRGTSGRGCRPAGRAWGPRPPPGPGRLTGRTAAVRPRRRQPVAALIAVLIEPDRPQVGAEILGTALGSPRPSAAGSTRWPSRETTRLALGAAGADAVTAVRG